MKYVSYPDTFTLLSCGDCWFLRNVINFKNQYLLGLLNFYGHHVEEILKIYLFTCFHMISFAFEIWHVEFLRFPPCVTSRWHREKAVVLEKKGLLLRFFQLKQFKYWERCLCVYVLARKEREIAFIAEVSARCFL